MYMIALRNRKETYEDPDQRPLKGMEAITFRKQLRGEEPPVYSS